MTSTNSSTSPEYQISGDSNGRLVINGNVGVYFQGTILRSRNGPAIDIQGGNPSLYLSDDTYIYSSNASAVSITNEARTYISVFGINIICTSEDATGAGIYVATGCEVGISSDYITSSITNKLYVRGGTGGAGIGGYYSNSNTENCGTIIITNVSVDVMAGIQASSYVFPGIGGATECGEIVLYYTDLVVYAGLQYYPDISTNSAPAIGVLYYKENINPIPEITIRKSNVEAERNGSAADYIGSGNGSSDDGIHSQCTIFSSEVQCYTSGHPRTKDKVFTFDNSGNATITTDI